MVDRRLSNCPICQARNVMFMYRTDNRTNPPTVTAQCSNCNSVMRVSPPSPDLSPMSEVRQINRINRSRSSSPRPNRIGSLFYQKMYKLLCKHLL